jgi:hypothetical protein
MYRRWTFKYSLAAVIVAVAIIAVSLFANLPGTTPAVPTVEGATFDVH